MVLFAVGNRRCTKRCYGAKGPARDASGRWRCTCVCDGKYHGLGLDGALVLRGEMRGLPLFETLDNLNADRV